MQKLIVYRTEDGETFEDKSKAESHEAQVKFVVQMRTLVPEVYQVDPRRVNGILTLMADKPETVAGLVQQLLKENRRIEKNRKQSEARAAAA